MTGANGPEVSAIVVSWKTRDLLGGCLRSLRASGAEASSMEIIVVDNDSRDGTSEMVRREFSDVALIENPANLGYTRANNQAIRASRGDYLLLVNADALLSPGCLGTMLRRLKADPRGGAVGPRLVYGDGRWQRWTAGRAPSLRTALNYYLFLERLSPSLSGLYLGRDVRSSMLVEWISSACMLVRRAAIAEVGMLDERFFAYMDDVDLCQRLRDGGWRVWYCPEAEAVHFMGQSSLRATGTVSPDALRSFNRYFAARNGPTATAALRIMQLVGFAARALAYTVASVVRREPALLARARAHWTYARLSLETPRVA